MIWLTSQDDRKVIMPTACKTWGCPPCAGRVAALFRARVAIGASRLGRCGFITVTYRAQNRINQTADVSAKDWRALLLSLKKSGKTVPWLKVTELTQQNVPHHHLIVGPVSGTMRCYGRETFDVRRHVARMDDCDCLSHVWSRAWLAVTGDSYICHVTPVVGPGGAGAYMAKYMGKSHGARAKLKGLGYARRWSSSRDWPGGGRLRLAHSKDAGGPGWKRRQYDTHRPDTWLRAQSDQSLLVRVGENLTLLLAKKRHDRGAVERLGKMANVTFNWA